SAGRASAEPAASDEPTSPAARTRRPRKAAATSPAKAPAKTSARQARAKASAQAVEVPAEVEPAPAEDGAAATGPPDGTGTAAAPAKRTRRPRKTASSRTSGRDDSPTGEESAAAPSDAPPVTPVEAAVISPETTPGIATATSPLFKAPEFAGADPRRRRTAEAPVAADEKDEVEDTSADGDDESTADEGAARRRRRRGGRGRRKKTGAEAGDDVDATDETAATSAETQVPADDEATGEDSDGAATRRRRRRRRRKGETDADELLSDDPPDTVVRVRKPRPAGDADDEVTSLKGSTRLEAKKQRRREGREAGRRRPPVISEAEFLARREAVDRIMVVRQSGDRIQIGVLEDGVLVEHYVSRSSQQSMVGNVYLGRVQNVLPAMEAAFVDVGRGRNAILYAGEVDWAGLGKQDGPRRIEDVLKSGQSVLVQVTKDPIGQKGARLTGQVSLPGRYVVYVPGGSMSGISRKLPDTERTRLKKILKEVVPEDSGVIVRTAAEGASEEELTHDVSRLRAQWDDIAKKTSGNAPALLYGEPDLAIKVVRDLFNEDFSKLVVSGDDAWDTIESYVSYVASSLKNRVERWTGSGDVFTAYRIDEQIAKALDRKVWLPSGGSLVIDRTEAMTVVDVNTGKFTGSGGNLEETVTKNNLEAAEETVRQLRLRDIGGIIVIDFIDMVLEANRDLVLRRLVECLGRDRTKHQVAEVTSLGLVQMTRKRIGTDLLEAFSETCEHCNGRGLIVHHEPVDASAQAADAGSDGGGSRRGRRRRGDQPAAETSAETSAEQLDTAEAPSVQVVGEPEAVDGAPAAAAPAPGAADGQPAQRRSRRRAQRPAGEPEVRTEPGDRSGLTAAVPPV
ncbi:MAG: Rne/Rng family ribonuclease, partial [Jiangellaceae bacterium]